MGVPHQLEVLETFDLISKSWNPLKSLAIFFFYVSFCTQILLFKTHSQTFKHGSWNLCKSLIVSFASSNESSEEGKEMKNDLILVLPVFDVVTFTCHHTLVK